MNFISKCFATISFLIIPAISFASTQCTSGVKSIWVADNGNIKINLDSGSGAYTPTNDQAAKNMLATATTALVANKQITVRYAADGVDCTSLTPRTDLVGLYLLK